MLNISTNNIFFQSFLLNASQLFSCDSSAAQKTSVSSSPVSAASASNANPAQTGGGGSVAERASSALAAAVDSKSGPSNCVLMQGWMLLAMAVSVFVPRSSRILWFLRTHFARNKDSR